MAKYNCFNSCPVAAQCELLGSIVSSQIEAVEAFPEPELVEAGYGLITEPSQGNPTDSVKAAIAAMREGIFKHHTSKDPVNQLEILTETATEIRDTKELIKSRRLEGCRGPRKKYASRIGELMVKAAADLTGQAGMTKTAANLKGVLKRLSAKNEAENLICRSFDVRGWGKSLFQSRALKKAKLHRHNAAAKHPFSGIYNSGLPASDALNWLDWL